MKQILAKWEKISQAYLNKQCIKVGCSKCEKGFIKVSKTAPDIGWSSKGCECMKEAESLRIALYLLEKSNIPLKYLKNNPLKMLYESKLELENENLLDAEALEARSQMAEEKNWFYISGEVGVGKTHVAVALAQLYLLQEQSVYFANFAKLLDDLRPDAENKMRTMQKALTCKVLILDDIGKEKLSEWVLERLFIIVNERYAWDRKTIFTSNISLTKLFKETNYPIYSRIMGQSVILEINGGKDKRL